jgi:hypothetical protein
VRIELGGTDVEPTGPLPSEGNLLFVARGNATVEGNRLELDTKSVEWFTDRPKRRAGIGDADELLKKWKFYGFGEDPPNAAVTGPDTDAVGELTDPEASDDGISFAFKPDRGDLSGADGTDLSVFIDPTEPEGAATYAYSIDYTTGKVTIYPPGDPEFGD